MSEQAPGEMYFTDSAGQEHRVATVLTFRISDETVLHCGCCGLPWATVTPDGVLVVESRHGGRVHENRLSIAALAAMVSGNSATNGETWGYSG